MHNEVQQTRWDRIIRRVSGSIGPGSRVSETLSELFPVLDVERVPAELLILGGTGLAFGGGAITAAAGEAPTGILFNPAGSNTIITITSIHMAFSITSLARWGLTTVQAAASIGTQTYRDTRRLPPTIPVGEISQISRVALAPGTMQTGLLKDVNLLIEDPNAVAVLAPGTGFEIGSGTFTTTLRFGFNWRERPVEPSELSL